MTAHSRRDALPVGSAGRRPIPARLHFIWWQGWHAIPEPLRAIMRSWPHAHPEFELHLWDRARIERLLERWPRGSGRTDPDGAYLLQRQYAEYAVDIQRIDLARLLILHRFGGLYADVDVLCLRSVSPLLAACGFYICREKEAALSFCNAVMAAAPAHPLLACLWRTLRAMQPWQHRFKGARQVICTTGPYAITQALQRHAAAFADACLDREANHFYAHQSHAPHPPFVGTRIERAKWRARYPAAYGLHLWAGAWRPKARAG